MRLAYVDTSCLVAIALEEEGYKALARRLAGFDRLVTSNLTEAELLSTLRRERLESPGLILEGVDWVLPDRGLTAEYGQVLERGYQKGADLFHLACALYTKDSAGELAFVSTDRRQLEVARSLGM